MAELISTDCNDENLTKSSTDGQISVGLSACLAGQSVRYNGGHSQSGLCLKRLGEYFSYITFCPEMAAGFGTPRPTMRLTGNPENPTLSYTDAEKHGDDDLTQQLIDGFQDKLSEFSALDGYILMKNSPSCGMERIKVYLDNGYPHVQKGQGIFTKALKTAFPLMPIEEEGRLHDPHLLENFVLRVFAHHRFRPVRENPSIHGLVEFHSRYKFVVLAHNQAQYRKLGKMVANAHREPLREAIDAYFRVFMDALAKPAKQGNHANVMLHLLGFLKKSVNGSARQNIVEVISQYQQGRVPLIAPITLLNHYIQQEGNDYLRAQHYLAPYPETLSLRNKV